MKVLNITEGVPRPRSEELKVVEYPDGVLILVTRENQGTNTCQGYCIDAGESSIRKVGEFQSDWFLWESKPWRGSITLEF